MLVKRRARMVGNNLRHPGMLATVLEGMVEGKNWKGRPRQSYEGSDIEGYRVQVLYEDDETCTEKTGMERRHTLVLKN
ncbi:hypothetical protein PGB90_005744 [Kerria lacca]